MKAQGDEERSPDRGDAALLSGFILFCLRHAECGEGPVEVRLPQGTLVEWCPRCAALGAFPAAKP